MREQGEKLKEGYEMKETAFYPPELLQLKSYDLQQRDGLKQWLIIPVL